MHVAAGSVRFSIERKWGLSFLFAAHLRNANTYFDENDSGAFDDSIMMSALGSKQCVTNDIPMIPEPEYQEIKLLD